MSNNIKYIRKIIRKVLNESYLNSNFWAWFGNSKIVNPDGSPMIMYHGSPHIDKIDVFKSEKNYYFFSNNKYEAGRYTPVKDGVEDMNRVKQFYIRAEKIFDPTKEKGKLDSILRDNAEYFISLYSDDTLRFLDQVLQGGKYEDKTKYGHGWVKENLSAFEIAKALLEEDLDNYIILEDPIVQKWIKENGYDSFTTLESGGGDFNIAVYSPNQIKSINNTGKWSRNDDNVFNEIETISSHN